MSTSSLISFRNMDRSPALAGRIENEVGKLRRHAPELGHCTVMVEALHRHHRSGHHYQVHIILRLTGTEVVVTHESPARRAVAASPEPGKPAKRSEVESDHRDAYVAVRDAFEAARRRLEESARRERHFRRAKDAPPRPRNDESP